MPRCPGAEIQLPRDADPLTAEESEDEACLPSLNQRNHRVRGRRQQQGRWTMRCGKHGLRTAVRKTGEVAPRELTP